MTLQGAVVNVGSVLDSGSKLPEGARVRVELADDGDDDRFPPPGPCDREKGRAVPRESPEDAKAGRAVPARQAPADLARKYGLPLQSGE